jgi:hypothetical protein
VNFVLHAHVAARDSHDDAVTLGAMLPDLWRMAARSARSRRALHAPEASGELQSVLAGVEHHLKADAWFHKTRYFVEGEVVAKRALARIPSELSPRLRLFAHATWEMCLDGALTRLVGADDVSQTLRRAIAGRDAVAREAADLHHGAARRAAGVDDATFDARMHRLLDAVGSFALPAGYATAEGVSLRLAGMRAGLGFAPPSHEEREQWVEVLAEVEPVADRLVLGLLEERW